MRHDYTRYRRAISFKRYRCRCSRCERRRTLTKMPGFYVRPPRCSCGARAWRVDWYRTARIEAKRTTCKCGCLPWPHRRGSAYALVSTQPLVCAA